MTIALVAAAVLAAGWWWWPRDEGINPPYRPEAYPGLSVTINGRPPADEIPLDEHWLFVVLAEPPPEFPQDTEFGGMVLISSAGDHDDFYADNVLYPYGPDNQAVRGRVDGKLVDITPPPLAPDDPRRQWVCVIHPKAEGEAHPEWPKLVVGEGLTLRVLMYPRDERGKQRVEEMVLVLEQDFELVEGEAD